MRRARRKAQEYPEGLSSIFNAAGRKKVPFEAVYPYVNALKDLPLLFDTRGTNGYNRAMDKKALFEYVLDEFGTQPEYLWKRYPDYCVFRHTGNRKWFAIVMDVPGSSLGLPFDGKLPVVNVKCDPVLMGSLRKKPGFLPAYHMNKESWLSVLLDGTVGADEIKTLIQMSYEMTR